MEIKSCLILLSEKCVQKSQLKSEEVRTLKEAVSISNEMFLTGYANYMEMLIARQNRLESELKLTEARKQQFMSPIFLYKAWVVDGSELGCDLFVDGRIQKRFLANTEPAIAQSLSPCHWPRSLTP